VMPDRAAAVNKVSMTTLCRFSLPPVGTTPGLVACLGNFDGLHLGHQKLLARLSEHKTLAGEKGADVMSALISFYPHPFKVLSGQKISGCLTTLRQKLRLLSSWGCDVLYLIRFTPELSRFSARDFIFRYMVEGMNVNSLVLGPDARLGHRREGTPEVIASLMAEKGRGVEVVEFLTCKGERVASRSIRKLLEGGKVEQAARLLGRNYSLDGRVVEGRRCGTSLGIPTANLAPMRQVLPARGVYATRVAAGGRIYGAATNVGVAPTFGGSRLTVESHLLDFEGTELKGTRMEVEFVARIRDEEKFPDTGALRQRIAADVEKIRKILG